MPVYQTTLLSSSMVSVLCFSPVHFQGLKSRQVSCYAFFKGWLLLSLPPCCLRFKTPFDTLNINFGTLTIVSVVPVSEMHLTRTPCFSFFAVSKFWVRKDSVGISLCKSYLCFTSLTNKMKLYLGIFQQEPAIAELERLFTPIPRLSDRMLAGPVQASIPLSKDFTLSRNRSPGFRFYPSDLRPFRLAFAMVPS